MFPEARSPRPEARGLQAAFFSSLLGIAAGAGYVGIPPHVSCGQEIWTCRVTWPLLSQYVTLLARNGSSGAGWRLPSTS